MTPETGLLLFVLLLVIGLPLGLSADSYFHMQRLNRPVVCFVHRSWREMSFWWTLFQTLFGVTLLVGPWIFAVAHDAASFALIATPASLLVAWRQFPAICLYYTYRRWDGRARFCFNRAEKRMTYFNRELSLTFALSEIDSLSRYTPPASRTASADYSYTVMHLNSGRTLVVTSLLCDDIDWLTILPAVKTEVIKHSFAWLPTDFKFKKFFSPFSN
ncbi:hypothetical protein [Hymenobacter properus]|uniref:PH domain-containing protein n=1 Tax=Hymenobacter properus TaxID=2791026 RepID=A0A931BGM5_9BACT|nr:hypothetical protein [Hymenobacter properus]MBF9141281.1 hypothetical protein [Hymenobacter properus]MBR7720091.1 hypothetical protein [Microvirga sp. SRT04]